MGERMRWQVGIGKAFQLCDIQCTHPLRYRELKWGCVFLPLHWHFTQKQCFLGAMLLERFYWTDPIFPGAVLKAGLFDWTVNVFNHIIKIQLGRETLYSESTINSVFRKCINLTLVYTMKSSPQPRNKILLPKVLIQGLESCIPFSTPHLHSITDVFFLFDDINNTAVFSDLASEVSCVV